MKYYRLNEDWYPFEEGTEFVKVEDGNSTYTSRANANAMAKIPTDLLDEINEINEINDSNYWKPMDGEKFYYIDEDGDVFDSVFGPGESPLDMDVYLLGNCFRTRKDAQAVVDWLRARQRLIKSGARFINSRDVGTDRKHFIVYFDVSGEKLTIKDILLNEHSVYQKRLYFDNELLAQKSVKEYKDDWLTYLGVKEKSDAPTDV